jgi:hypothetical protein
MSSFGIEIALLLAHNGKEIYRQRKQIAEPVFWTNQV